MQQTDHPVQFVSEEENIVDMVEIYNEELSDTTIYKATDKLT